MEIEDEWFAAPSPSAEALSLASGDDDALKSAVDFLLLGEDDEGDVTQSILEQARMGEEGELDDEPEMVSVEEMERRYMEQDADVGGDDDDEGEEEMEEECESEMDEAEEFGWDEMSKLAPKVVDTSHLYRKLDTSDYLTRLLMLINIFILVLNLGSKLPRRPSEMALKLVLVLATGLVEELAPKHLPSFLASISSNPKTLSTVRNHLNLNPTLIPHVLCPKCYYLHPPLTKENAATYPRVCAQRETHRRHACKGIIIIDEEGKPPRPSRVCAQQTLESWLAHQLVQPGFEKMIRNGQRKPTSDGILRDIWDGSLLASFCSYDGKPWLEYSTDDELRITMSVYQDWYNPFGNVIAGKTVSSGVLLYVIQELPRELRWKEENVFIATITPGREPNFDEIVRVMDPSIISLVQHFIQGVHYSRTSDREFGVTVRIGLITLLGDLPGNRKSAGFNSASSGNNACFMDKITKEDLGSTDIDSWTRRTVEEWRRNAYEYRRTTTKKGRTELVQRTGTRHSSLQRVPGWNPTQQVTIDVMHAVLAGLAQNLQRDVLGSDLTRRGMTRVERDAPPPEPLPPTATPLTNTTSSAPLPTSSEPLPSSPPSSPFPNLPGSFSSSHPSLSTSSAPLQSTSASTSNALPHQPPTESSSATPSARIPTISHSTRSSRSHPSSSSTPSTSTLPLQPSTLSSSAALLIQPPTPSSSTANSAPPTSNPNPSAQPIPPPRVVLKFTRPPQLMSTSSSPPHSTPPFSSSSNPTSAQCLPPSSSSSSNAAPPQPPPLSSSSTSQPAARKLKRKRKGGEQPRRDGGGKKGGAADKEEKIPAILGKVELKAMGVLVVKSESPTDMGRLPGNYGATGSGKLSADQWKTNQHYLAVLVVSLWGVVNPDASRTSSIVTAILHLASFIALVTRRSISLQQIARARTHIIAYLEILKIVDPTRSPRPNDHACLHILELLRLIGPAHTFWTFPAERLNGILGSINHNNKVGQLEVTAQRTFGAAARLSALLARSDIPELQLLRDIVDASKSDKRGTLLGDMVALGSSSKEEDSSSSSTPATVRLDQTTYSLLVSSMNASAGGGRYVRDSDGTLAGDIVSPYAQKLALITTNGLSFSTRLHNIGNSNVVLREGLRPASIQQIFVTRARNSDGIEADVTWLRVQRRKQLPPDQPSIWSSWPDSNITAWAEGFEPSLPSDLIHPADILCLCVVHNASTLLGIRSDDTPAPEGEPTVVVVALDRD